MKRHESRCPAHTDPRAAEPDPRTAQHGPPPAAPEHAPPRFALRDPVAATPDQIAAAAAAVVAATADLPTPELRPSQQCSLGAHLHADTPRLVDLTAHALADHPALFPDAPTAGDQLLVRQHRADSWLVLSDTLSFLARRARAAYLQEQGATAQIATSLLLRVEAEAQDPSPLLGPLFPARQRALFDAFDLYLRQRSRSNRRMARTRAKNRPPTASASASAPPPARPRRPRGDRRSGAAFRSFCAHYCEKRSAELQALKSAERPADDPPVNDEPQMEGDPDGRPR